jgi:SAM-dependent methyltransferase
MRRVADLGLERASVLAGSAEEVPLADGSVDLVHARFAYFFGPRSEAGVAEVARVLRPGGSFCVIDNDWEEGTFATWLRLALGARGRQRSDRPGGHAGLLERAGFLIDQDCQRVALRVPRGPGDGSADRVPGRLGRGDDQGPPGLLRGLRVPALPPVLLSLLQRLVDAGR